MSLSRLAGPVLLASTALAMTALLAACEIERTPRPVAADADSVARVDIRTTLDAYQHALLSGDAVRAASFFGSDSRLIRSDANDLTGAAAVRDELSSLFDTTTITAIALDRSGIDMIRGGGAWEHGTWSQSSRVNGGHERTRRGRYAIRWRAGPDARWIIDTFMLSDYPADTAATR